MISPFKGNLVATFSVAIVIATTSMPANSQSSPNGADGSLGGEGGVASYGSGNGGDGGAGDDGYGGGGGAGGGTSISFGTGGAGTYSGSGGDGGGGGSGGSSSNSGVITGGAGVPGLGGVGMVSEGGGGGGGGGIGYSVDTSASIVNTGTIAGGSGGMGGASGGFDLFFAPTGSANGGNGGGGGAGIVGSDFTLSNSGIITGGAGGIGGDSYAIGGGDNGNGGAGGAAVVVLSGSAGTRITNLAGGQITGGFTGGGSASGGAGIDIQAGATIIDLTNNGNITAGFGAGATHFGILNSGVVTTLNNAQGASSSALTYSGALPTNYNIIINSPTSYGKLAVTGATGVTTFGIYSGSTVRNGIYSSVLSGLNGSNLTTYSSTYGSGSWTLAETSAGSGIWDLFLTGFFIGPSTADTQQSLVNTANALQPIYTLQNSVLANSFTYDCSVFGANGVCVSAGGRNTSVQGANGLNNTSALLIASYRLDKNNSRIGAYADQNLSVNNSGSAVTLGNNTPLIGVFGVWSQRPDGIGAEVKVSAAYGQKDTTITRQVVGDSEAGSGSSTLNSQGAQVIAKYGFGLADSIVVSPYVGVRYTQNNMNGYTESTSATVTAPLTYSSLNTNATTALAGVGASYKVAPQVTTFASAGVETDTNTSNGTYSATGVNGLTPVNFNPNPVITRPTATVGAYYDIVKNQRFGVTGIYRQEAYQAVSSTTVMATYTIGL